MYPLTTPPFSFQLEIQLFYSVKTSKTLLRVVYSCQKALTKMWKRNLCCCFGIGTPIETKRKLECQRMDNFSPTVLTCFHQHHQSRFLKRYLKNRQNLKRSYYERLFRVVISFSPKPVISQCLNPLKAKSAANRRTSTRRMLALGPSIDLWIC